MEGRQKQVIEAYERVQDFMAENPVASPWSYGEPKAMLDDVIAQLSDHGGDQVIGAKFAKAERDNEATHIRVLREQHLRPISLIAKGVLSGSPGIDQVVTMPRPTIPTTKLLKDVEAFREAGVLYEGVFAANGRPADFLAQLDAAVDAVKKAFLAKARNVGKKAGAKEGLALEIARGRKAIGMLDAIVTTAFVGNGRVLGRWRSASRIRGLPGGTLTVKTGATPTTAPAVSTSAASPDKAA